MSLQENSESGDEDLEREERRPCFSSGRAPSNRSECELDRTAGDDKVRRGILAGRREGFGEGIVNIGGAVLQQPCLRVGESCRKYDVVSL